MKDYCDKNCASYLAHFVTLKLSDSIIMIKFKMGFCNTIQTHFRNSLVSHKLKNIWKLTLVFALILVTLILIVTTKVAHNGIGSSLPVPQSVEFQECECQRIFSFSYNSNTLDKLVKLNSSCSDETSWYHTGQKVVSFTYHIPHILETKTMKELRKLFRQGILENLVRMRQYYPGFVMRIYSDAIISRSDPLCEIVCNNTDLQWCDISATPSLGDQSSMHFMTWRFLPLGDPTVELFLSRDLDSIISKRESAAVHNWLENPEEKSLMVIRDHPSHNLPLLGGTWSSMNNLTEQFRVDLLQTEIVSSSQLSNLQSKDWDQTVLFNVLWAQFPHLIVAYDSYNCGQNAKFLKISVRPIPVRRKNNSTDFVGNPELGGGSYSLPPCPVECRPSYGKDWTFC